MKFAKVMCFHMCLSVHKGSQSLSRGVSVLGSLCPLVCVQGDLCPGGSLSRGFLSRGSLSRGVSVQGVSVQGGLSHRDPPYGNERVVHILLERILVCVKVMFLLQDFVRLSSFRPCSLDGS